MDILFFFFPRHFSPWRRNLWISQHVTFLVRSHHVTDNKINGLRRAMKHCLLQEKIRQMLSKYATWWNWIDIFFIWKFFIKYCKFMSFQIKKEITICNFICLYFFLVWFYFTCKIVFQSNNFIQNILIVYTTNNSEQWFNSFCGIEYLTGVLSSLSKHRDISVSVSRGSFEWQKKLRINEVLLCEQTFE